MPQPLDSRSGIVRAALGRVASYDPPVLRLEDDFAVNNRAKTSKLFSRQISLVWKFWNPGKPQ